ncbi:YraN family protein [Paenimyroides viscosum]|uniref:UPF0102 protein EG242_01710 n=1 Tax=Paenimyroides viscosum TaxID=2488729 RepID=A0A3P1B6M6_9FLAO|nr:YraN family protein [Paenimyroides viscosum]RRA96776.1 endonuclease [Paenimyroides viscosum]
MATHNETGKKGEQLAKEFLEANNYVILETNYRYKKAEIDIIALKNNILAIIEVKTRTSIDFGEPESFVNNKKIKLILEATNAYIDSKDIDYEVSLDIISVVIGKTNEINHIENAYYFF